MEQTLLTELGALFGGGTVIALLLWFTRGAIVTAVKQAADRELLTHKGKLDEAAATKRQAFEAELEEKKQAFTRELERDRERASQAAGEAQRAFAKDLERFKTDLTIGAAMRSRVVAERIQALDHICTEASTLVFDMRTRTDDGVEARIARINNFMTALRGCRHFFSAEFEKAVTDCIHDADAASEAIREKRGTASDAKTLMNAADRLVERVRKELNGDGA